MSAEREVPGQSEMGRGDMWQLLSKKQRTPDDALLLTPEEVKEAAQIEKVRSIWPSDYRYILSWVADPEVAKHLEPPPDLPTDWNSEMSVREAEAKLQAYYTNFGEPHNITPIVAVNTFGDPVGVATIRWRGDPYVPKHQRIASIERVVVDPLLQGQGVGTTIMATAIDYGQNRYHGYTGGQTAKEMRIWVMTDFQARPWDGNYEFFRSFGFQPVTDPRRISWKEYAAARGIETHGRDAIQMKVTPEWFEAARAENLHIQPHPHVELPYAA